MIVTFYSYKGGVGRSFALANIAVQLAQRGFTVLAVDFDLEAPGLSRYFTEAFGTDLDSKPGVLDLLTAAAGDRFTGVPDWKSCLVGLESFGGRGRLDTLTSGRRDAEYAARLLAFDWKDFFAESQGGPVVEALRREWSADYDFVLVDSRTGLTDAGGVCTIQLPDVIVGVFTANHQSVDGLVDVISRAQAGRQALAYDRPPALVIPLPSRFDSRTEHELAQEWLDIFSERFRAYFVDWLPQGTSTRQALERMKIPHVAYYSFGEKLPVLAESNSDPESMSFALAATTDFLEQLSGHTADAADFSPQAVTGAEEILQGAGGRVRRSSEASGPGPLMPAKDGREAGAESREPAPRDAGKPFVLTRLMLWLAGVDTKVLARFPADQARYLGVGSIVLTTSTLAGLSCVFALRTALDLSLLSCLALGVGWGLAIMCVQRWLVVSLSWRGPWYKNLLLAAPHILLGLMVGLIMSIPVLLTVFEAGIEAELVEVRAQHLTQFEQDLTTDSRGRRIENLAAREAELQYTIATQGGAPADVSDDPEVARLQPLVDAKQDEFRQAEEAVVCELEGICGSGISGTVGAGIRYAEKVAIRGRIRVELDALKTQLDAAVGAALARDESRRETAAATAPSELEQVARELAVLRGEVREETQEFAREIAGEDGLLIRFEALDQLTSDRPSLGMAQLLLTLFITESYQKRMSTSMPN